MPETISALGWSADGKYVLAGTERGVALWNVKTCRQAGRLYAQTAGGRVSGFALPEDSKELEVRYKGGEVGFFDMATISKAMGDFEKGG